MAASFMLADPLTPEMAEEIRSAWSKFLSETPKDSAWMAAFEKHKAENAGLYRSLRCVLKE